MSNTRDEQNPDYRIAEVVSAPSANLFGTTSNNFGTYALLTNPETGSPEGSNAEPELSAATVLYPPLNVAEAIRLKDVSPHHASCVTTKKNSMVGLGFMSDDDLNNDGVVDPDEQSAAKIASLLTGAPYIKSNVDTILDPLTSFGFANELSDWVEDMIDTGSAYMEVARKGDQIVFIGALSAKHVKIVKKGRNIYFQVQEKGGQQKYFSRFGMENKAWMFGDDGPYDESGSIGMDDVSEIIYLSEPTNRCRHYGYPSWLAAAVDIDLAKGSKQYKADFLYNRGVLDFILSILGTKIDPDDWEKINASVSGTAGKGHNFKNLALNIAGENVTVQVDKLAADSNTEEQFAKDNEVFSQNIVTAHGVPPLLANILIPGKLGSSNEFVNSLISFQLLRVGPVQQIIQKTLASSLGNSELNGGLKLKESDFRLRTLTSQLNLKGLETLGGMREEATTSDRDLDEGMKNKLRAFFRKKV